MDTITELKRIRNYFGEHDKTQFEHFAYSFLDNHIKEMLAIQQEPRVSVAKGRTIRDIQLCAGKIDLIKGFKRDVAFGKPFIEMTIDFKDGTNTVITLKELQALLSR
ncbi:MAG: hypothetical protein ACYC5G_04325 [Candidatus Doudnabacteria bacterium]